MLLRTGKSVGAGQRLWPVFALLIAVVALPTGGVLWFMNQAMQNEQAAATQRLREVYRSRLQSAAGHIEAVWREKLAVPAAALDSESNAAAAFAAMVRDGHADAVLFYDNGSLVYPEPAELATTREFTSARWEEARTLEYVQGKPLEAATVYGEIARTAKGQESALARMAEARCMNKAGRTADAIEILLREFDGVRYRSAVDLQGRQIRPSALLFALELMRNQEHPAFVKTAGLLAECLNDYASPVSTSLRSSQRRFLMRQLQSLWPDCPPFPTQTAEDLAAAFAQTALDKLRGGQWQSTKIEGTGDVWAYFSYLSPERSMIALVSQKRILQSIEATVAEEDPLPGVRIAALPPGDPAQVFMTEEIGEMFPAWKLGMTLEGPDPFRSAVNRKITLYIWMGVLMTGGIVILSILLATWLRRQVQLTRLKNDLIATVSHELKTPLASMRLLVDTLRDGHCHETQLVEEYLALIAQENARLSRLIEDFLTFSRMERNKAKFEREVLPPRTVIDAALEAMGDRLRAPGCRLELEAPPELPAIVGDRDALATVLVNLLDNALKYSGEEKAIGLRAFTADGHLYFEVRDNGIGFPRGAVKKIFERFYQVDRSLSRRTGGAGLGLSIVKFIVDAHVGTVTAESQQGKGSVFTVKLPAVES
ncbi:MAG: HAMP domain-containing histidine kinase [Acidobacteriota bacterium]|jgi:signal transduction histidine kinase|nr:HAMP domain-containing histidine kinase [Acidobacteriota bacterium]